MGAGKLGFPVRLGNEVRFSARGFHQGTFRAEVFTDPASVPSPGGLLVTSYTTRFTPFNSLIMRVAVMAARSEARPRAGRAGLLDAAAGPEDVLLGEHRPHNLQPDGQTFDKTARHGGRRLAGKVERPCQRRPIEPLGEARGVG